MRRDMPGLYRAGRRVAVPLPPSGGRQGPERGRRRPARVVDPLDVHERRPVAHDREGQGSTPIRWKPSRWRPSASARMALMTSPWLTTA